MQNPEDGKQWSTIGAAEESTSNLVAICLPGTVTATKSSLSLERRGSSDAPSSGGSGSRSTFIFWARVVTA